MTSPSTAAYPNPKEDAMPLHNASPDAFITLHEDFCSPVKLALQMTFDTIRSTLDDVVGPDYGMGSILAMTLARNNLYELGAIDIPF